MKTYIQLGRAGDIINILPLLHSDFLKGEKQGLMVAKEFAGILDGISYVEPVIYDGPHYEIGNAVEQCKAEGRNWICTQINGPKEAVAEFVYKPAGLKNAVTTSFQKEMWRVAGRLGDWDLQMAPLFDRRDLGREHLLKYKAIRGARPKILVCDKSVSSPFPYGDLLWELLKLRFSRKYELIDLGAIQAERLYDLLGLMEEAYCLISVDTAILHLASGVRNLPVVALTNDKPMLWNGSSWRPWHIWYCRYNDFPVRAPSMLKAIEERPKRFIDETRIVHVWNDYEQRDSVSPWLPTPIEIGSCGRDSALNLKDPKRYPFLRDCIRMGLQRTRDGDFMALTRPGLAYSPSVNELLMPFEAAYAYRIAKADNREEFQPVVDLFFARKCWWKDRLPDIPDLIFGADYFWSHALWALFKEHGATDATGCVWKEVK